jgi:NitT/TauT family transport system ATP-binding protein
MAYELREVRASYGGKPVLDGISLSVDQEKILVVLGPSGCGKSTLLHVIAGLKETDSGERSGFEGKRFSYAFQEPRLLPWLRARDNAAFALSGVMSKADAELRIDALLRAAGLEEAARLLPRQMSGGMRQRLSLVRAFAYPSDLLLLDEAFQAVDLPTKLELMDVFLRLWKEERRAVICVTHDIEEAVYLADEILVLSERPARRIGGFRVSSPREGRALGSESSLEDEARLYGMILGREIALES